MAPPSARVGSRKGGWYLTCTRCCCEPGMVVSVSGTFIIQSFSMCVSIYSPDQETEAQLQDGQFCVTLECSRI